MPELKLSVLLVFFINKAFLTRCCISCVGNKIEIQLKNDSMNLSLYHIVHFRNSQLCDMQQFVDLNCVHKQRIRVVYLF